MLHRRKGSIFEFNFHAYFSLFYGNNKFSINKLSSRPYAKLLTEYKKYNDVWIFEATDREYETQDDFIEKLYWSKSNGAVKYEKKNGEVWELVSKKMRDK